MLNLIIAMVMIGANVVADNVSVWAVEYEGDIYEYEATDYDDENAVIVTKDGREIRVVDIL